MAMTHQLHRSVVATCALLLAAPAALASPAPEPPLTEDQRAQNLESFDLVWSTIRDRHFDPSLGGVDWDGARDELRPKVAAATTSAESRAHFESLLERLGQSHHEIVPAEMYDEATEPSSAAGDAGFDVDVVEGRLTVTAVRSGSPAFDAGVCAGWIVTSIDGVDVGEVLAAVAERWGGHDDVRPAQVDAARNRLFGDIGSETRIEFIDDRDHAVTKVVRREQRPGFTATLGDLPTTYVELECSRIDDRFGVVRISFLAAPGEVMPRVAEAMRGYMDTDGIVFDLRGNRGGLAPMAQNIAGWLVPEPTALGTMRTRRTELPLAVYPREATFHGPVAVLVDGSTASAAEIMAGGLQGLGRARVFGTTSAGAVLPAAIIRLPNGDGLIHAIADYECAGGARLEGRGVVPDVVVDHARADLLAGRDAPLQAALAWLESESDPHSETRKGDRAWESTDQPR